jgi:hypothetical protein
MTYGDDSQPHDPVDPAPGDQPGYGTEPGYGSEPGYNPEPGYAPEPGYLPGPSFGQVPGQAPGPFGGGQQPYGGGQQYVPYGAGYSQPSGRPPTHLPLAVVSLLFCWPASIVAIIYASQVKNKWARGDQQGAMTASRRARTWAIVSFVVGVLAIVYLIAFGHTTTGQVG